MTVVMVVEEVPPLPSPPTPPPPPGRELLKTTTIQPTSTYRGNVLSMGKIIKVERVGNLNEITYRVKALNYPNVIQLYVVVYGCFYDISTNSWSYSELFKGYLYSGTYTDISFYISDDQYVILLLYATAVNYVSGYDGPSGYVLDDVDLYSKPQGKIYYWDDKKGDYVVTDFYEFINKTIVLPDNTFLIYVYVTWYPKAIFKYTDPRTGEVSELHYGIDKVKIVVDGKLYKSFSIDHDNYYCKCEVVLSEGKHTVNIEVSGYGWFTWKIKESKSYTVFSTTNPLETTNILKLHYDITRYLVYLLSLLGVVLILMNRLSVGLVVSIIDLLLVLCTILL